jgi:hypothetical protein
MEPQYMIMGHAAGVAASLAIRAAAAVQDVSVAELQKLLKTQAAVFDYVPTPQARAFQIIHQKMAPKGTARFNWEY